MTRFTRIYEKLMGGAGAAAGEVDARFLAEVERRDNVFPEMDYRVYAS